jgi:CubicO group peptidase (beta-lactamase class C family)
MYSVLVIRNGYLVAEQYFNGQDKYDANTIASASKSYIGVLIGIALKENYLTSLDQKMMDFFPEYITPGLDPRKFDITIRHLLTMRAGYLADSTYDHWGQWISSNDWMKFALDVDLVADPGQNWNYSTSSTHLLSGILTKATDMSTREFAEEYLFKPLQISCWYWHKDPHGYYCGGWEMYFSPRDMARFGLLYLNKGFVDGKQIVPAEWVEESIKTHTKLNIKLGVSKKSGYGYLWWLGSDLDYDYYFASGHAGQYILIIPNLDMVIVTTANTNCSFFESWNRVLSTLKFITYNIISPVIAVLGPPPYSPAGLSGITVENRSLTQVEYLNVLKWQPTPRNEGINISKYRIYLVNPGDERVLLGETDANRLEYWHRNIISNEDFDYTYGVSSVTGDNKESVAAIVTVR